MLYLEIDIGKGWHETALLDDGGTTVWRQRVQRVAASRAGFDALDRPLTGVDVGALTAALEATGVYWLALHAWRTARGVARVARVVVLKPRQTKAFRDANRRGSKAAARPTASTPSHSHPWCAGAVVRWCAGWARPSRLLCGPTSSRLRRAPSAGGSPRTELVELRVRQLVKLGGVLDRLFPEFRAAVGKLGCASAPAARSPCARRAHARGHAGLPDPLDAVAVAARSLVANVEHLDGPVAALGARLAELRAPPTPPPRRCSARAPGSAWLPHARGSPKHRRSRACGARTARRSAWRSSGSTCASRSRAPRRAGRR